MGTYDRDSLFGIRRERGHELCQQEQAVMKRDKGHWHRYLAVCTRGWIAPVNVWTAPDLKYLFIIFVFY